jgi:hypothetical protein
MNCAIDIASNAGFLSVEKRGALAVWVSTINNALNAKNKELRAVSGQFMVLDMWRNR